MEADSEGGGSVIGDATRLGPSESLTRAGQLRYRECGTAGRSRVYCPGSPIAELDLANPKKVSAERLCSPIPRPWSWASSSEAFGLTGPRTQLPARLRGIE